MSTGSRLAATIESAFHDRLAAHGGATTGRPAVPPPLADEIAHVLASQGVAGLCDGIGQAIDGLAGRMDRVSLAVTGLGWLGGGVPAVERTLTELLGAAEHEILLTAYSMTPGTGRVWEALETALATGVRCTLIAHRLDEQHPDIRSLLLELLGRFPGTFRVHTFAGSDEKDTLHAKLVIVDRRVALVGSANLTFHGMVSAHELAIVVRGPTAELIAGRVDLLLRSLLVRPYPG